MTHPTWGRPRSFKDPQELSDLVDKYLADCKEVDDPPLMLELALVLGISRETLSMYARGEYDDEEANEVYSDTFKRARTHVEVIKNKMLIKAKGSTIGLIFDLKNNHGWCDKVDIQSTQNLTTTVKKDMSTDEAQEAYSKQMG